MDLKPYVDNLRRELAVAADAGGEDARELAERLTAPLESAIRLTLLDALSSAADEITRDLAPGSVDLRLRGLDPSFVVTPPAPDHSFDDAADAADADQGAGSTPAVQADTDDGAMARINVRLSEALKARVEEAAGRDGLSINAWFVRAAAASLDPGARSPRERRTATATGASRQRLTGWVS
ncbi:toxin-antitoxin system HicB family antitoxin [Solihabitans fulvus]|uniref:Toxin-antitoxin system HicB family antitoxin n=1 Tax=Solihabitans fulvus TaxID=1892852 RepID=A0A5B2WSC5_9PSEU|nr:toxin-antitoxin system HicB family antitoxin [Solihabitans fulvus]KAA2253592.1 toxin-antitoxin system HicB family antitoxin [Solihabitans fulvus]